MRCQTSGGAVKYWAALLNIGFSNFGMDYKSPDIRQMSGGVGKYRAEFTKIKRRCQYVASLPNVGDRLC